MKHCYCGCRTPVSGRTHFGVVRRFVTGHNLRILKKTKAHCKAIAAGQRRAWKTKRKRLPLGTKYVDACGYVLVKTVPGKGAWRKEHILVAERTLGRRLRPAEVVHHINGNRTDNDPANLYVCRDRQHHGSVHRSEAAAFRLLLARGFIVFKDGHYEAVLRTP